MSLLNTPQQNVVPMLDAIAIRARTTSATARRATLGLMQEIDQHVMVQATKELSEDQARIVRHYYTGGAWDKSICIVSVVLPRPNATCAGSKTAPPISGIASCLLRLGMLRGASTTTTPRATFPCD